jgi:translation initiation factor 5
MAAIINIAGLTPVHDPAYRYKMPKLIGKVEGKGNGIKTVLVNIIEVAEALKREAPEVTKFFGCELGAQTTYSDRAVVNGAHRDADLQNHLSKYIENFVLCKSCRLPETHYKVKEGIISQKCLACGHKETVDMTHKLTTFIFAQYKRAKEVARAAEKSSKKKVEKVEKKPVEESKEKKTKSKKTKEVNDGGVEVEGDAEPDEGEDTETVFNKLNVQGTEEDESEEKLIGM